MKMRSFVSTIVTVVSFLLLQQSAFSQINRENIDDAFKEMEDEKLTLYFFNALDGESIENAKVTVEGSGSFSSDANGRVFFTPPPDGVHKVHFHKTGFEAATFEIEIMVGSIFFNRFSVSPALPIGNVRIVLDWDKSPRDLDAHFVKAGTYHISYRNMRVSSDGNANLDRMMSIVMVLKPSPANVSIPMQPITISYTTTQTGMRMAVTNFRIQKRRSSSLVVVKACWRSQQFLKTVKVFTGMCLIL